MKGFRTTPVPPAHIPGASGTPAREFRHSHKNPWSTFPIQALRSTDHNGVHLTCTRCHASGISKDTGGQNLQLEDQPGAVFMIRWTIRDLEPALSRGGCIKHFLLTYAA